VLATRMKRIKGIVLQLSPEVSAFTVGKLHRCESNITARARQTPGHSL
jgi:hypothetical protein